MSKRTLFVLPFLLIFSVVLVGFAQADAVTLKNIVDSFNSQNDGRGMTLLFADGNNASSAAGRSGMHSLGMTSDEASAYLGAYLSPTTFDGTWQNNYATLSNLREGSYQDDSKLFFNSFCVDRSTGTSDNTYVNAQLSFVDNGDGTYQTLVSKQSGQTSLTLGAALVYQDMLLGKLDMTPWTQAAVSESWRNDPDAISQFGIYDIQVAIWAFQTGSYDDLLNSGGNTADYLEMYAHVTDYLTANYNELFGDDDWWFADYDPVNHNIDGYSVLVVNLAGENGGSFQDHIILVENPGGGTTATPEPGTMTLFAFGGLASLLAWKRRRRIDN